MYSLKEFKEKFDPVLENFLEERISEFNSNTSDPFLKEITYHAKDLVMNAGKRVRPYIAYCMYKAAGGKETDKAIEFFISLEIFHMFLLIHDDIMDKAKLRHSVVTEHTFVINKLKELKRNGDLIHVGNSQAILIGDLLFSWAAQIITLNKYFKTENLLKVKEMFYKTLDEVILGQMIDVDLTTRDNPDLSLINAKTYLKTAGYSFIRPMQIGANLGDVNNKFDKFAKEFGTKIGIAFQTQDDYLDIMGDPKLLHKNILGDVVDHQATFFTNYVLNKGTDEEKKYLKKALGKELNDNERKQIKNIFIESGAISAGKKIITKSIEEAKTIVNHCEFEDEYKLEIYNLIALLENRKS